MAEFCEGQRVKVEKFSISLREDEWTGARTDIEIGPCEATVEYAIARGARVAIRISPVMLLRVYLSNDEIKPIGGEE